MQCFVYKGERKDDHYLFLKEQLSEIDDKVVPQALLEMLGPLTLVTEFELSGERQLAQADAKLVLEDMRQKGFYLQMPKTDMNAVEDQWFN